MDPKSIISCSTADSWTSRSLISCSTAYYWTSRSIIRLSTAYYWTSSSLISCSITYYWTSRSIFWWTTADYWTSRFLIRWSTARKMDPKPMYIPLWDLQAPHPFPHGPLDGQAVGTDGRTAGTDGRVPRTGSRTAGSANCLQNIRSHTGFFLKVVVPALFGSKVSSQDAAKICAQCLGPCEICHFPASTSA